MTKSSRIAESRCLSCGKALDGVTDPDGDASPSPGDVTVCIYCGHIMAFGDGLLLRELTSDEMHDVAADPVILEIQRVRPLFKPDKTG